MRQILSLQLLRGLAAAAVVVTHFQTEARKITGIDAAGIDMNVGAAGVDLFFVISGFVMVYASETLFGRRDGPVVFFLHRIVRIVPLYWVATTLYVLIAVAMPAFGKDYSPGFIGASYFFIPMVKSGGDIEPVVGQGWTLSYEMFFYVLFALAVLARRNVAVLVVAAALAALIVLARAVSLPLAFEYWGQSMVLEFVFGMLIALIHRHGVRVPRPAGLAMIVTGLVLLPLAASYLLNTDPLRCVKWGLPAALVVGGATLADFSLDGRVWKWLARLGDASYALYLFHAVPIRVLLYAARSIHLDVALLYWPLLVASVLAAIGLALAIFFGFERPVTRKLRGYLPGRPQTPRAGRQPDNLGGSHAG